jgi:hypothetical protein
MVSRKFLFYRSAIQHASNVFRDALQKIKSSKTVLCIRPYHMRSKICTAPEFEHGLHVSHQSTQDSLREESGIYF